MFEELIKELDKRRKHLGLTFRELGQESGYSFSTIHKIIKYKRNNIRLRTFADLAETLGLKIRLELDDE